MRFHVPVDCCALVHEGELLTVAPDRSLEAPEEAASILLAHGIVPSQSCESGSAVPDVGLRDVETMSRSALLAALNAFGETPPSLSTGDLRRALRQVVHARRT